MGTEPPADVPEVDVDDPEEHFVADNDGTPGATTDRAPDADH